MNKQSGFTTIELIIVITIVAILAAIAIPAWMDYKDSTYLSEQDLDSEIAERIMMKHIERRYRIDSELEADCSLGPGMQNYICIAHFLNRGDKVEVTTTITSDQE
jgi:prepilin-type N-terminal cleavage/methylation domain-containing protein